jgi:hypothetical protein
LTSDRRNLSAEPTYPAERGETPGKESTHQEKGGILASPTGAASIPAAETPASASPHESVPSGAGEDRPHGPTQFSALGPTESEARRSLLTKVGEHLTQAALRAGRPIEMADWVPGELWTQKNFARSIVYRQIPSKTPGVNLSTAEVTVDPLDERKIEQVFAEFVNDRVAGRSLSLLKGFAGTVLVLGGASVFLRLGTGRTLTSPAGSSKQKSWLQRLRRNTK